MCNLYILNKLLKSLFMIHIEFTIELKNIYTNIEDEKKAMFSQ